MCPKRKIALLLRLHCRATDSTSSSLTHLTTPHLTSPPLTATYNACPHHLCHEALRPCCPAQGRRRPPVVQARCRRGTVRARDRVVGRAQGRACTRTRPPARKEDGRDAGAQGAQEEGCAVRSAAVQGTPREKGAGARERQGTTRRGRQARRGQAAARRAGGGAGRP